MMMPNLQQAMGVLNPQAMNLQGGQLPATLQQQLGLPPGQQLALPPSSPIPPASAGVAGVPIAGVPIAGVPIAAIAGIAGVPGIPGVPPGFGAPPAACNPTLADMMVTHKEREPPKPIMRADMDLRLALVNIPQFVQEKAISELLGTFGKLKYYRLLSREEVSDPSESIVFFEYYDIVVQNQAKSALQGLDLGKQKLSVMTSDEVFLSGKLVQKQTLGDRIVPSRVLYLQNLVQSEELYDDDDFDEIFNDVKLECECFGVVTSMMIPRPHPGTRALREARKKREKEKEEKKVLALEDGSTGEGKTEEDDKNHIKVEEVAQEGKSRGTLDGDAEKPGEELPEDPPGVGYAFVEFADIEGASKAKKALSGRKFGLNEVAAEYFSEDCYTRKDFETIKPNTVLPKAETTHGADQPEEEEIEFIS